MTDPEDREWLAQVRADYERPLPDRDAARERLLERLRREPATRRTRWSPGWWVAPGALALRPAVAAAALALVLALGLVAGGWYGAHRALPAPRTVASLPPAPAGMVGAVTFALNAPGASRVALVGDFNGWDPEAMPLKRSALGDLWTTEIRLDSGMHTYAYVIDGRDWLTDPSAPMTPDAAFGARHSVVVVAGGDAL